MYLSPAFYEIFHVNYEEQKQCATSLLNSSTDRFPVAQFHLLIFMDIILFSWVLNMCVKISFGALSLCIISTNFTVLALSNVIL